MLAVLINCAAVIAGSLIGLLFSRKITDDFSKIICSGAGVITLILGFQMAFEYGNVIFLTLSLILGGIVGSWWDIDGKILLLGKALERRFTRVRKPKAVPAADAVKTGGTETGKAVSGGSDEKGAGFAYAFLNASVVFCVGAMAIVGSFQAGVGGGYTIILTKSVLDGFMAIVFAAALGAGTAFSAVAILVYQGLLTLSAGLLKNYVSDQMISELTGVGGALIIMIGINLLDIKKLKTANYLPAVIFSVIFVLVSPYLPSFY